jgi:hypothetical protein
MPGDACWRLEGNLRPLFAREHPMIAAIVVFGMLGVRIAI